MTTRSLAIFASDIVGSTPTTVALDRRAYEHFRGRYEQIVVPILQRGRGDVFKAMGDGYLASFASSTDAVIAALEVQAQLCTLDTAKHIDDRFGTRIGISSGDVDVQGGDCFGVPVILATRVQGMAEPGTTYVTESVYYTMNRNEVDLADLGYVSVKGFEERQRVFRAQRRGDAPRTQTFSVLATDLRGFTRAGELDPERADREMRRYDEVVLPVLLACRGLVNYVVGDQYLATFERPGDAVLAAFRLQCDWAAVCREAKAEGEQYEQLVVGLDHGRHFRMAGRLWGSALSSGAQRMAGLAKRSEVWASGELVEALRDAGGAIADRFSVAETSTLRVKGRTQEAQVHRLELALDGLE